MSTKKNVLIIGGSNFMGFTFREAIIANGSYDVTVLNRGKRYWCANDNNDNATQRYLHLMCDRNDSDRMLRLLNETKKKFDVVVDFCAYTPQDIEPLFELLRQHDSHYVFISTDSIYEATDINKHGRRDIRFETDDIRPSEAAERARLRKKDKYGDDKLRCEEALAASNVKFTALRLADVFGPRDTDGGSHRHWKYQLLVKLCATGRLITLTELERKRKLSMIYSEDVASLLLAVIATNGGGVGFGEAYNVACNESLTIEEYVRLIGKHLSVDVTIAVVDHNHFKYLPSVTELVGPLDVSKATTTFGWRPTSMSDALLSTVRWFERAWREFPSQRPRDDDLTDDEWSKLENLYE